ncbi:SGNH/GDSL hydrolase family protein [Parendozoicomonas haliclonae]|uniref:Thermolabile hemolysin n=1 Tax=Parendozoicomonas haliclonae TaxID=1960125 RepID=A0A1X7APS1_9GAMM|nr:SGNH/GDSL hydrolase family protein [Parendozoicomonas haliclonae]SMA50245.1 Thermolabile hemolysin precursor [Parendozoicomonas haliclonae]
MTVASLSVGNEKQSVRPIDSLVIFGDSLSDNANTWRLSHYYMGYPDPLNENYSTNDFRSLFSDPLSELVANVGPAIVPFPAFPSPPYNKGYFSNGPTTVEYVAAYAGLDISKREQYRNLAFGASWTTDLFDTIQHSWELKKLPGLRLLFQGKILPPNLGHVLSIYLSKNPVLSPDTIYAIFFSGNDYINGFTDPSVVVAKQFQSIRALVEAGAKHIFWGMVPDYSLAPCFHLGPRRDLVTSWGVQHNKYVQRLAGLIEKAWPEVKFTVGDISAIFRKVALDPDNGFLETDKPCTNVYIPGCDHETGLVTLFNLASAKVCPNEDDYLFWDQVHVTTRAHRIASWYVCELFRENGYHQMQCPDIATLRKKSYGKTVESGPHLEGHP